VQFLILWYQKKYPGPYHTYDMVHLRRRKKKKGGGGGGTIASLSCYILKFYLCILSHMMPPRIAKHAYLRSSKHFTLCIPRSVSLALLFPCFQKYEVAISSQNDTWWIWTGSSVNCDTICFCMQGVFGGFTVSIMHAQANECSLSCLP